MQKYVFLAGILGLACSAPAPVAKLVPAPEATPSPVPVPAPVPLPLPGTLGVEPSPLPLAAGNPSPVPSPKALQYISEIKTPASTAKLAHLVAAPLISPISRIAYAAPLLPQVSPYALAYSPALAPLEIAPAAPSTYSIEQHGYHITY